MGAVRQSRPVLQLHSRMQADPEDVIREQCALCSRGNEHCSHIHMPGACRTVFTWSHLRLQAHPEDVIREQCALCSRGDEHAHDWVCCDTCNTWSHFSCDTRPDLGAFKVCCTLTLQSYSLHFHVMETCRDIAARH